MNTNNSLKGGMIMDVGKNKEKIYTLIQSIHSMGRLKIFKNKIFNFYEYNEYLKKVCEYNIRCILEKYCNGGELTDEEKECINKYINYSSQFYGNQAEGPSLDEIRLQSQFGSGDFDYEELQLIQKINREGKINNKVK